MTRAELAMSNNAVPSSTRAVRRAQVLRDLNRAHARNHRVGSGRPLEAWTEWGSVYAAFSAALAGPNAPERVAA